MGDAYEARVERQIEQLHSENEVLKLAMLECAKRLSSLSGGTDGVVRAQICKANNFLLRALGQPLHYVAQNWHEDDPDYRRLISDAETVRGNE